MRSRGFTLFEGLAASVILAIVVLAISQVIVAGHAHAEHAAHTQRAGMLAEDLAERVIAAGYDGAMGFDGYAEGPGEASDITGAPYGDGFAAFARSVAVHDTAIEIPGLGDPVAGREVEVTVIDDRGQSWVLIRFIASP